MYALVTPNNEITQIGELQTLFPNEYQPTALYAQQHGAKEIIDGNREDERFYWVTFGSYSVGETYVTRNYVNTAKALEDRAEAKEDNTPLYVQVWDATANNGQGAMVDTTEQVITKGLKSNYIAQFKQTANSMLAQTDWVVIRKAERSVDIPAETVAKRAAILAECDRLTAAVTAAQDMPSFITAVQSANWS
jgi:hypothetical protein